MWHHRRTCIRYGASPSRQWVPTPLIRQRRLRQRMGVDLPTVQRVSGHKTFEMVFRYSHQNQQHLQEALSKLDERIVVSSPADFSATPDQRGYTGTTRTKTAPRREPLHLKRLVGRVGIEPTTNGVSLFAGRRYCTVSAGRVAVVAADAWRISGRVRSARERSSLKV
jgi:hypothetical protein